MELLLYENIHGFYLFHVRSQSVLNSLENTSSYENIGKLTQIIQLHSKYEFTSVSEALEIFKALKSNLIPEKLLAFLDINNVRILYCDSSLFINLNNLGIRTKIAPHIFKGIKSHESKLLNIEINEKTETFKKAFLKKLQEEIFQNTHKNDLFLAEEYYKSYIKQKQEINKVSQKILKLFEIYFPEFSDINAHESIEKIKILQNFHNDSTEILKEKADKCNINLLTLQETLGTFIDWKLMKKYLQIYEKLKTKNYATFEYLEAKITKIFPLSHKFLGIKTLASLVSKISYEKLPFIEIKDFRKLCPLPNKKLNKNIKNKYMNTFYSCALKILRLEFFGALNEEIVSECVEKLEKTTKNILKEETKDFESIILTKLSNEA